MPRLPRIHGKTSRSSHHQAFAVPRGPTSISLRTRLIASITLVLLISLAAALLSAGWSAARSVRTEMQAALAVGEQTIRHAYEDLSAIQDPLTDLSRLVRTFDGDRHLSVALLDPAGRPIVASALLQSPQAVPDWFARLIAPPQPPRLLPIDPALGKGTIVLTAAPMNELGEVWSQLQDSLAVLTLSCGLSIVLVSMLLTRALRPLQQVSVALAAIGSGEYDIRVPQARTFEMAGLVQGFNTMAVRLGRAKTQNRHLHEQLLTLQEEERAELARDLHDEVGPFLFTVALDAAEIGQVAAAGQQTVIGERALAIREAVSHMQRHVRAMLKRLRLASPVDVGLAPALENLVLFWRRRRPETAFILEIAADEDGLTEATKAVIYRIAQEALSNAIRHGRPSRVEVTVTAIESGSLAVSVSDDGIGLTHESEPGFGLAGMQERVTALGGSLHVTSQRGKPGLTVMARLPSGMAKLQPEPAAAAA